jgi:hypothetical protein
MFIATLILFTLPCSLLWVVLETLNEGMSPVWRTYGGKAALILAICATLLESLFSFLGFTTEIAHMD